MLQYLWQDDQGESTVIIASHTEGWNMGWVASGWSVHVFLVHVSLFGGFSRTAYRKSLCLNCCGSKYWPCDRLVISLVNTCLLIDTLSLMNPNRVKLVNKTIDGTTARCSVFYNQFWLLVREMSPTVYKSLREAATVLFLGQMKLFWTTSNSNPKHKKTDISIH